MSPDARRAFGGVHPNLNPEQPLLLKPPMLAWRSSRNSGLAAGALAVQAAAAVVGWWLGWYEQIEWYDELVHVGFGFAVTLAAGIRLHGRVLTGADRYGAVLVLVLIGIGLGVGALWELLEFTFDQLNGPDNAILGKVDTMIDLFCDAVGAAVGAVWAVSLARA